MPAQRRGRAGRHARRLQAVQAALHGEEVQQSAGRVLVGDLMRRDQRERVGAERGRVLQAQVPQQLGLLSLAVVPFLAGHLAGTAADAPGDVDQRRLREVALWSRGVPAS